MQEVIIHDKTFRVLIEADKIQQRVKEIGTQINSEYKGKRVLFLGVMNGAFLFAADLFKSIDLECEISFIRVSSYSGTESTGAMKNVLGLNSNIEGREVIIIEDIVDTGDTMKYLKQE